MKDLKKIENALSWYIVITAILSIIAGFAILMYPASLNYAVAFWLLFNGFAQLVAHFL